MSQVKFNRSLSDPHAPNFFRSYFEVHETVLENFKNSRRFIESDTLTLRILPRQYRLFGEISCLGNIVISVEKFIEIVGTSTGNESNPLVKTSKYAYNAFVRGANNIFRYDNLDDDPVFRGHPDCHHKHIFDWQTGQELKGSPEWIGEGLWPTLGQVIQEASDWYSENLESLSSWDSYGKLGQRSGTIRPSLETRNTQGFQEATGAMRSQLAKVLQEILSDLFRVTELRSNAIAAGESVASSRGCPAAAADGAMRSQLVKVLQVS